MTIETNFISICKKKINFNRNEHQQQQQTQQQQQEHNENNQQGQSLNKPAQQKQCHQYINQYLAAFMVSISAIAAGTVLGWTAPSGPQLTMVMNNNTNNNNNTDLLLFSLIPSYGFILNTDQVSWLAALMGLGGAIMCIPVGIFIRLWGCKFTLILLIIPITIGWILIIAAQNFIMLVIGRFLAGMSGGSFLIGIAVYIGEISAKEIRGILGSFLQLFLNVGMLIVFTIGNFCNVPTLSLFCGLIPLIFGIGFWFMPETPYFWITRNKPEQAKKALSWLNNNRCNYDVDNALADIQSQLDNHSGHNQISLWASLKKRSSKYTIIIGIGLMFGLQMSGINVIQFYATDIFIEANIDIEPGLATIMIGFVQVIATLPSVFLADRLGRKILLIASITAMTMCNIILGGYFYASEVNGKESVQQFSWVPIVILSIFVIMFSVGYGPIPWVMLGEIFSSDIKEFASSLATTVNWLLGFIVGLSYPALSKVIHTYGAFWFFAGFSLCMVLFSIFIIPETKGKSLDEIQLMFKNKDK